MSLIPILGGIPQAAAVIDATSVGGSVSFDSNSGFTSVTRSSKGLYLLVLSRDIQSTKLCCLVSVKAPNNTTKSNSSGSYRITATSPTTIEVNTNDNGGYGNIDADFSIAVYAITT